ncbi:MAG: transcriptional regulator [Cellvibrionaceae bacterium]
MSVELLIDESSLVERIVEALGGQSATGRIAGVTQQTVGYWIEKNKIRPDCVRLIESALIERGVDISRYEIDPDVFGSKSEALNLLCTESVTHSSDVAMVMSAGDHHE